MKIFFFINTLVKILMAQDGAKNLKRDLFKTYDSQSRPIQDSNFSLDICVGNIIYLKILNFRLNNLFWSHLVACFGQAFLFHRLDKVRAIQNFPASRKSTFYYFYIKKHQKW